MSLTRFCLKAVRTGETNSNQPGQNHSGIDQIDHRSTRLSTKVGYGENAFSDRHLGHRAAGDVSSGIAFLLRSETDHHAVGLHYTINRSLHVQERVHRLKKAVLRRASCLSLGAIKVVNDRPKVACS